MDYHVAISINLTKKIVLIEEMFVRKYDFMMSLSLFS